MLQDNLTQRQQQIFNFILHRMDKDGFCPTIREIATEFDFKSPNGVMCHLKALEKKGLITRTSNKSRSITLTSGASAEIHGLPLAGIVSAGSLMEAIEDSTERIETGELFGNRADYVLQVEGDSMIDAHIQSGDYVIVRKCRSASRGDIVVARTGDGEATLKYWYPEKNRIRLQPANKTMKPIYSRDARVVGVVVGSFRRY